MSSPGDADDLLIRARSALLDALDALGAHRDSIVVIGAQAIYLHTAGAAVAVAEATKDSDLAIDPRTLRNDPLIEKAMERAGFYPDPEKNQPGAWLNPDGVPVDLMVPEALAGGGGKGTRGARVLPHDKRAMRRAIGLEAAVVENEWMVVGAFDPADRRRHEVRVAAPAALVVAKMHKIGERAEKSPDRLVDKDAHDVYRVLVHTPTAALAVSFRRLLSDALAGDVTAKAVELLGELFAAGPDAVGSLMAGRTEEGVGEPETVALQTAILASDLLDAIGRDGAS
jgi:hypothetical protein